MAKEIESFFFVIEEPEMFLLPKTNRIITITSGVSNVTRFLNLMTQLIENLNSSWSDVSYSDPEILISTMAFCASFEEIYNEMVREYYEHLKTLKKYNSILNFSNLNTLVADTLSLFKDECEKFGYIKYTDYFKVLRLKKSSDFTQKTISSFECNDENIKGFENIDLNLIADFAHTKESPFKRAYDMLTTLSDFIITQGLDEVNKRIKRVKNNPFNKGIAIGRSKTIDKLSDIWHDPDHLKNILSRLLKVPYKKDQTLLIESPVGIYTWQGAKSYYKALLSTAMKKKWISGYSGPQHKIIAKNTFNLECGKDTLKPYNIREVENQYPEAFQFFQAW